MEPDAAQQESQESGEGQEEEEDEDEADPAMLAKKQKQLAKRGVTFEAKVDPKVTARQKTCSRFATCSFHPSLLCGRFLTLTTAA